VSYGPRAKMTPPRPYKGSKKPGLNRVKGLNWVQSPLVLHSKRSATSGELVWLCLHIVCIKIHV